MNRIVKASIYAAAVVAISGAELHAQSPNAVADMCAHYARQSWPEDYIYNSYDRARQQVFNNCMTEHGLRR